jgi:hypothetical protein
MSAKNRKPETKQRIIIELWEQTGKESAGETELGIIQEALLSRFGASESPASIARILADEGVPLQHPKILEADSRWRLEQTTALFSSEELNFATMAAASEWVEKVESLHRKLEGDAARLRLRTLVLQIKGELELVAVSTATEKDRQFAQEVAQWLTVWLQNPQIFAEWLSLRRSTVAFKERFE